MDTGNQAPTSSPNGGLLRIFGPKTRSFLSGLAKRSQRSGTLLKKELLQFPVIMVLAVVVGLNVIIRIEEVRRAFPLIQATQLWFHRSLCSMAPRLLTAKWVRAVEIDQQEHAKLGDGDTLRAFLAKLISQAVRGDAAVVVLDIKLLARYGMSGRQRLEQLTGGEADFLLAVKSAAESGVPVVLAELLLREAGEFRRAPSFFLEADLPLPGKDGKCPLIDPRANATSSGLGLCQPPACVRIGNINAPTDLRQVPLVTQTKDSEGPSESLALAAASAYEDAIQREPRTNTKERITSAIKHDEFVFASFIPESAFQRIPIEQLAQGTKSALSKCRGRIIIVGGNWREDAGVGPWVDNHDTPVGEMRGMYCQANYIEALLDDRYQREVPLAFALVFDLIAGALLYIRFHKAKTRLERVGVLLIPGFLLVASYIIFTNFNLYLDFVLPLLACFVHLGLEYVRDYGRMRKRELAGRSEL